MRNDRWNVVQQTRHDYVTFVDDGQTRTLVTVDVSLRLELAGPRGRTRKLHNDIRVAFSEYVTVKKGMSD